MAAWFYFDRPTHLAYHDFTTFITPPKNLRSLLGLGLKFIPSPRFTTGNVTDTLTRLRRDLWLKTFFAGSSIDDDDYEPKMSVKSGWSPPDWEIPAAIQQRYSRFSRSLQQMFRKRRGQSNLLPHQRRTLQTLQVSKDLLVVQCDKNLGPAVIETSAYIKKAYDDHLSDTSTYKFLTGGEANNFATKIRRLIEEWLKEYKADLTKMERKFLTHHLQENVTPFPVFYLTMKAHKEPMTTRPIVSCIGSLLHGLGVWVDRKLQSAAQHQRSYFKSSFELMKKLTVIEVPPGALLFTADAVSMYTNILTHQALRAIAQYLRRNEFIYQDLPIEALISALRIVMLNNVFTFGDTAWHQLSGTAMGTPPAPPYATVFYGIHEDTFLDRFPSLRFYKRFIDDVIGIWVPDPDPAVDAASWTEFQACMNSYHGMQWTFSDRGASVDFMDLTISLRGARLHTTLYEKALNLYLYIPPHSSHPPGVLTGLVLGNLYRIDTLCSDVIDKRRFIRLFYRRLLARGYKPEVLRPLFLKAAVLARDRQSAPAPTATTTPVDDADSKRIFLHLRYHPNDPFSFELQQAWKANVAAPRHQHALSRMRNKRSVRLGFDRMTVAYSRAPNLGNLLSYRLIDVGDGPPVSSYRITD